jgi:hypothetical protein
VRANLRSTNLEQADLTGANLERAVAEGARLANASAKNANLQEAELQGADLRECDLGGSDLRRAILTGAQLDAVVLTGAKIAGIELASLPATAVIDWADASIAGDGSRLLDVRHARQLLGGSASSSTPDHRFFGAGDVLRNADLEFREGAKVHIESRMEGCTIRLSGEAELVLGEQGSMNDCAIEGGRLTIHGRFFEGRQPGLAGPRRLAVSKSGAIAATVAQPEVPTEFSFERGCRLRLDIKKPTTASGEEP